MRRIRVHPIESGSQVYERKYWLAAPVHRWRPSLRLEHCAVYDDPQVVEDVVSWLRMRTGLRPAPGDPSVEWYTVQPTQSGRVPAETPRGRDMTDRSNGYEGVAAEFLAGRGRAPSTAIGTRHVRDWARTLAQGAAVLDLGCGSGLPITRVLVDEGLDVFAVDASPSLVRAFRRNLPQTPVACESVEDSAFFDRRFDGVLAWGLVFLLPPGEQRRLLRRIAGVLVPGGRLLFTAPPDPLRWNDAMTELESRSLGAAEYRRELSGVGLWVTAEYEDEGQNHYYDAMKPAPSDGARPGS